MNRLIVTRRLPPAVEARCAAEFDASLRTDDAVLSADDLAARADGAEAILCAPGDRIDAALVERLPASVRVVGTFSVGTDHIDAAALKAHGIALCNTPDVLSRATAEITLLLILAAARRAGEGERMVRAGRWTGWAPTQLIGTEISGRRLGIYGMGRIGREVARMARGFSMEVHYRNRSRLAPEEEAGAIYHESDESLLAVSDILSLNAPASPQTLRWLNAERIERLPPHAIVVNAARGTLVDDEALIAALASGRVAAAGLDVFAGEPKLHPGYLDLENAVLLPHLGSATQTARDAMGFLALDGIAAVLRGERPANLVE
ncbi:MULTISPECIES: 2-hydroxyacid dehydrogenase [unclassified Aureimonas]|uniref:2-hydroxyacid dehydrogenase n=1 Tax=unclassified Aureimonas TaxID=2615206 RepID=UPI000701C8FB|nr:MULTISPECIES: D-glycerate dehydrogenase [unclassified Aureimonas]KQT69904.1 D-glycerate dehydrogenase [Aureimonas sp. Leaf427]KQT75942.1 D-glycerate dehydrogenase [Aureimonas sp. Leaf460]